MYVTLLFYFQTINFLFALAGLGLLVASTVLVWDYYRNDQRLFQRWLLPHIWFIIVGTTAGGIATTLLYSEVFGFIPCSLCWLQRIALYPQLLLCLAAWQSNDRLHFPRYGRWLSVFGLVVATYHYIYQSLPKELLEAGIVPCLADGTADCGETIMNVFGFVTFPFLSGVLFFFLTLLYLHLQRSEQARERY